MQLSAEQVSQLTSLLAPQAQPVIDFVNGVLAAVPSGGEITQEQLDTAVADAIAAEKARIKAIVVAADALEDETLSQI